VRLLVNYCSRHGLTCSALWVEGVTEVMAGRLSSGGECFGFYDDAARLPTCYLSSGFTLGFVAPKTEFCFLNVLSSAIAESAPVMAIVLPSARSTNFGRSRSMVLARSSLARSSLILWLRNRNSSPLSW